MSSGNSEALLSIPPAPPVRLSRQEPCEAHQDYEQGEEEKEMKVWREEAFEACRQVPLASDDMWFSFLSWNWRYWVRLLGLLLVLEVVQAGASLTYHQMYVMHSPVLEKTRFFELFGVPAVIFAAAVVVWCHPLRGHSTIAAVSAFLVFSYVAKAFLVSQECSTPTEEMTTCIQSVLMSQQPPLFTVILMSVTCRLRPHLLTVLRTILCAVALLWLLGPLAIDGLRDEANSVRLSNAKHRCAALAFLVLGAALVFGSHVAAHLLRRQQEMFQHLNNHIWLSKDAEGGLRECELRGLGTGTEHFFREFVKRSTLLSFPAEGGLLRLSGGSGAFMQEPAPAMEARFQRWRSTTHTTCLQSSAGRIAEGMLCLAGPLLWLAAERVADSSLPWPVACVEFAALGVTLLSAILVSCVPRTIKQNETGLQRCLPLALGVFVIAQTVHAAAFLLCSTLESGDLVFMFMPLADESLEEAVMLPSDPLCLIIFVAHTLTRCCFRTMLIFDVLFLLVFVVVLASSRIFSDRAFNMPLDCLMLAFVLLTIFLSMALTLTLEKYDRIIWRLRLEEGQEVMMNAPTTLVVHDSSAEQAVPSCDTTAGLGDQGVEISVRGSVMQYADELFYYVQCTLPNDSRPRVVLRSIFALRARLLELLESGSVSAVPVLSGALEKLACASAAQQHQAERRLEAALRQVCCGRTSIALQLLELAPEHSIMTPRMNILLLCVGGSGDLISYIAMGKSLQAAGHRCRVAAHVEFEAMVRNSDLEFFPLATLAPEHWQPALLMQHLERASFSALGATPKVLRPRDAHLSVPFAQQLLMPAELYSVDHTEDYEPSLGPWAAAIAPDPLAGREFLAQAIVATPGSLAHVHVAERLGVPCQLAQASPWVPSKEPSHPMAATAANKDQMPGDFWSKVPFRWEEHPPVPSMRTTSYLQSFRRSMRLPPVADGNLPSLMEDLRLPIHGLFSPSLLRRPEDWGPHVEVCGAPLGVTPSHESRAPLLSDHSAPGRPVALQAFLDAGDPPVYIGFGSVAMDLYSIVVPLVGILIKDCGCRVVIQRGLGAFGAGDTSFPQEFARSQTPGVFFIGAEGDAMGDIPNWSQGPVDHDWLFPQCRTICHHGGSGTSHRALLHGRPSLIIAFLGDQPLWGALLQDLGAARLLLAQKVTFSSLRAVIAEVLAPAMAAAAVAAQQLILCEVEAGAGASWITDCFERQLPTELLRCDVCHHSGGAAPVLSGERRHVKHIRLARFYDSQTRLRLCDVCCYLRFIPAQDPDLADERLEHLHTYRPLDWASGRRRCARAKRGSTVVEDASPAGTELCLRGGGVLPCAIRSTHALLRFLAAQLQGRRRVGVRQHASLRPNLFCRSDGDLELALSYDIQKLESEALSANRFHEVRAFFFDALNAASCFHRRVEEMQKLGSQGFALALASQHGTGMKAVFHQWVRGGSDASEEPYCRSH